MKPKMIKVPPDGGWGWVICFAFALSNVISVPIIQTFGLIFQEKFQQIGFSATDTSIIINVNSSFGMLMGLLNGTLLKKFGYRKISILGAVLMSTGMILTAYGNSFITFFISYGLITSFGFGLSMSSLSLAVNTYFEKKRSKAFGFAMTGTGLGPIVMPVLVSYLLDIYDTTGCVLIIAGLSMHTFVAACLLQPVKWHMKKELIEQELIELGNTQKNEVTENLISEETKNEGISEYKSKITDFSLHEDFGSILSIDHDVETQSIYGFGTSLPARQISQTSIYDESKPKRRKMSQSVRRLSSYSINTLTSIYEETTSKDVNNEETQNLNVTEQEGTNNKSNVSSFISKIIIFFDFNLLCDPIYINMMMGMSIAICAELNFALLTPFILNDLHFNTHEIAEIMSAIAITDIIFRFCAPFIADWLKKPPRVSYLYSLIMLIITRSGLLFVTSYTGMIILALFLGVAKGLRTVFMTLLIPSYVPIEKLPSASGIQMVVNGIITMIGGPILGVIRDLTGSFYDCILVINGITLCTVIMWSTEFLYLRFKKK